MKIDKRTHMNDENEDVSPVKEMLTELEEAALEPDFSADSDSPRDVWWLRWLKFMSIITLPAVVLGLGFLFEYGGELKQRDMNSTGHTMTTESTGQEVSGEMKFRFWLGASVGGSLGLIYVARCIIRKTDP